MEFRGQDGDGGDVGAGSPPMAVHDGAPANGRAGMPTQARRQYHECRRNHAAATGGHVVDGCCEFMLASPEDALACAARAGSVQLALLAANTRVPLLLPPAASKHPQQRLRFPYLTPSGGTDTTTESSSEERRGPSPAPRRHSRTTFAREQKEQMLAFAERVGWRIQRQDEATVEQFCTRVGVRRQALKVWMHNNKQSSTGRRQQKKL